MTDEQRELIAHALGVPLKRRDGPRMRRWAFRNYFYAGPVDQPAWRDLEVQGFAEDKSGPNFRDPLFIVTRAGVEASGLRAYVPNEIA